MEPQVCNDKYAQAELISVIDTRGARRPLLTL